VTHHTPDASKSHIKTPVKLRSPEDWGYHDVIEDANGEFLCECPKGKGEELASIINTHTTLRASWEELREALVKIRCRGFSAQAENQAIAALANAAKVRNPTT